MVGFLRRIRVSIYHLVVSLDVIIAMFAGDCLLELLCTYAKVPHLFVLFDFPLLKRCQVLSEGRQGICVQGKKQDTTSMLSLCCSGGNDGPIKRDRHPFLHEALKVLMLFLSKTI